MAKNPERTRTSILDAADRLLRRGGGGTVDEVAREARCAKGLVHYHFKTKAALLAAAAARLGGEAAESLDGGLSGPHARRSHQAVVDLAGIRESGWHDPGVDRPLCPARQGD